MLQLKKQILEFKPTLKKSSIDQYARGLMKLKEILPDGFGDVNKTIEAIERYSASPSTQKNFFNLVVLSLQMQPNTPKLSGLITKYAEKVKTLGVEISEYNSRQELNAVEKEKQITFDEIFLVLDILKSHAQDMGFFSTSRRRREQRRAYENYLILLWFIQYPHRNTQATLRLTLDIKDVTSSSNWIHVGARKITYFLNDYKTAGRYGPKVYDVKDPELKKALRIFAKHLMESNQFLLPSLSTTGLTMRLKGIFEKLIGKTASTTMIRKALISKEYETRPRLEEERKEAKEIENRFLHSRAVNRGIYQKY